MPEHCREGRDREAWQADWKAPLRSRRPKHHLKGDETSKAAEAEERSPASGEPSRLPPAQGPDVRGDLWATGSMAWPLALALGFRDSGGEVGQIRLEHQEENSWPRAVAS